jgi:hypothetical protein
MPASPDHSCVPSSLGASPVFTSFASIAVPTANYGLEAVKLL